MCQRRCFKYACGHDLTTSWSYCRHRYAVNHGFTTQTEPTTSLCTACKLSRTEQRQRERERERERESRARARERERERERVRLLRDDLERQHRLRELERELAAGRRRWYRRVASASEVECGYNGGSDEGGSDDGERRRRVKVRIYV